MSLQSALTGLQVGMALLDRKERKAYASMQAGADREAAKIRGRVQNAGNFARAAEADLSRFVVGLQNRRNQTAAGVREGAAKAAIAAQVDWGTSKTFEGRLRASEAAGEVAAKAAISGVAGGTYDVIAGTGELQQARQEFADRRAARNQNYGLLLDASDAARTGIGGLDNRTVFAAVDYSVQASKPYNIGGSGITDVLKVTTPGALAGAANDIYNSGMQLARQWGLIKEPQPITFTEGGDL